MPIVQRIVAALEPLVQEFVVLTNDHALKGVLPDATLVFDPDPHAGVLPALAAGLRHAHGEVCLAVACDMPFVSRPVFEMLLGLDGDVVIPRTEGYLEPMHAVYRREPVLRAIESALQRGEQRMISYFRDVKAREVAEDEWRPLSADSRAFFNVNTPEELEEANRLASQDAAAAPPQ